jgi:hypothetical protein
MILGPLLVGLLVFYWYGTRPAVVAAVVTFGVFVLTSLLPVLTWYLHGALAVAVGGVCFLGPRRERPAHAARATRFARHAYRTARKRLGL